MLISKGLKKGSAVAACCFGKKRRLRYPRKCSGRCAEQAEDLNIYGVMRGAAEPKHRAVPNSPADNATGSIESLIARTEDPFEQALSVPKSVAEDDSLPAGNSIRSARTTRVLSSRRRAPI